MNTSKEIKAGDHIEDIFGEWHTVVSVDNTTIITLDANVHITKVIRVLTPDDFGYSETADDETGR